MQNRYIEEWQNGQLSKTTDLATTMTPAEVFTLRQQEVRELAGNKIELLVGDAVKQRNMMAYAQMLQRKEAKGVTPLTPTEQATLDGFEAQLVVVMTIRQVSNAIEAEILALNDSILMMDYNVATSPLWP